MQDTFIICYYNYLPGNSVPNHPGPTTLSVNSSEIFFIVGFTRVSNNPKFLAVEIFGNPVKQLSENLAEFVSICPCRVMKYLFQS